MALTAIEKPQIVMPVNNIIPLVYSSTFSGETGFYYKISIVYVGSGLVVDTVDVYPDVGNNGYCIFNLAPILKNYIEEDVNWDVYDVTDAPNSLYCYKYTITEYIDDTSNDTYSSDELFAYRGVVQYGTFFNYDDYSCVNSGDTGNFLTNFPQTKTYKIDEYDTVNTFFGSFTGETSGFTTGWDRVYYNVHEKGGRLGQYFIYYTGTTAEDTLGKMVTIPSGPKNINDACINNNMWSWNETSGYTLQTDPIIVEGDAATSTDYYEIDLKYSGYTISPINTTTVNTLIRVDIDEDCYRYTGVQFLWLGELGSYETHTFRLKDRKNFETDRVTYNKPLNNISNNSYTYNLGDRSEDILYINSREYHKVYSGYINDDDVNDKLMELYTSPDVYIIKNDNIYPIIIINNNIESFNIENDKTWIHEITFRMAYQKLSNL